MRRNFTSHVQLSEERREGLIDLLNTTLASILDAHQQTKYAHWNVKGRGFYSYHLLFDEVAKHLRKQVDEIAERCVTLGGVAEGTIRLAAENSDLSEYNLDAVTGVEHVRALVDRLGQYSNMVRKAIERTGGDLDDAATQDIYITHLRQLEMDIWFLEAHIEEEGAEVHPRPSEGHPTGKLPT